MLSSCYLTRKFSCFVKNELTKCLYGNSKEVTSVSNVAHRLYTRISKSNDVDRPIQEVVQQNTNEDGIKSKEIIKEVNDHIRNFNGKLFAIIYLLGKQYKVTTEDILIIERYWAPKMKDNLRFEKVLLVGSANFTLIGKPILPRNVVNVTASIVNKDLTHTKFRFLKVAKERIHNLNFVREELTFLRINKIEVYPHLNELTYSEYSRSL